MIRGPDDPNYTTCPRCARKNCAPQFCRFCADHFGPRTPWPCLSDSELKAMKDAGRTP